MDAGAAEPLVGEPVFYGGVSVDVEVEDGSEPGDAIAEVRGFLGLEGIAVDGYFAVEEDAECEAEAGTDRELVVDAVGEEWVFVEHDALGVVVDLVFGCFAVGGPGHFAAKGEEVVVEG